MQSTGYTLIELVVVLIIFSLLAAITAPRLATLYNSVQISYEKSEVIARLNGLSYVAFRNGQNCKLTQYPLPVKSDETKRTPLKPKLNLPSLIKKERDEAERFSDLPEIPLKLPDDWQLKTDTPIVFHANGVCEGGIVHVIHQEMILNVTLIPPFCYSK